MSVRAFALLILTACNGAADARAKAGDTATDSVPPAASQPAPSAADAQGQPARQNPMVARADSARIRGTSTSGVWLVIASDFQCPYCRLWHDSTDLTIRREYVDNGRARMAFINFPLSNHQNALPAAEYAMCAGAQRKFWEMHDGLFETQGRWSDLSDPAPVFDEVAGRIGLDLPSLKSCVTSRAMLPLIEADRDRALRSGVQATPSFFVGDVRLQGVQSAADLRKILDAALAGAKR